MQKSLSNYYKSSSLFYYNSSGNQARLAAANNLHRLIHFQRNWSDDLQQQVMLLLAQTIKYLKNDNLFHSYDPSLQNELNLSKEDFDKNIHENFKVLQTFAALLVLPGAAMPEGEGKSALTAISKNTNAKNVALWKEDRQSIFQFVGSSWNLNSNVKTTPLLEELKNIRENLNSELYVLSSRASIERNLDKKDRDKNKSEWIEELILKKLIERCIEIIEGPYNESVRTNFILIDKSKLKAFSVDFSQERGLPPSPNSEKSSPVHPLRSLKRMLTHPQIGTDVIVHDSSSRFNSPSPIMSSFSPQEETSELTPIYCSPRHAEDRSYNRLQHRLNAYLCCCFTTLLCNSRFDLTRFLAQQIYNLFFIALGFGVGLAASSVHRNWNANGRYLPGDFVEDDWQWASIAALITYNIGCSFRERFNNDAQIRSNRQIKPSLNEKNTDSLVWKPNNR